MQQPHVSAGKTEAQRGYMTGPGHTARQWHPRAPAPFRRKAPWRWSSRLGGRSVKLDMALAFIAPKAECATTEPSASSPSGRPRN